MQTDFINLNLIGVKYHGDKKGNKVYLLNILPLLSYLQYLHKKIVTFYCLT